MQMLWNSDSDWEVEVVLIGWPCEDCSFLLLLSMLVVVLFSQYSFFRHRRRRCSGEDTVSLQKTKSPLTVKPDIPRTAPILSHLIIKLLTFLLKRYA